MEGKLANPIELDIFFDITKSYEDKGQQEPQWFVEGYATTDDPDLIDDKVTEEAIKSSEKDLLENSTVLRNHHLDEEIGKVVETKAEKGRLKVKILISKTVPEIWKKVQEGVLNKFSIRMKILDAMKKYDTKLKRLVNHILRMKIVELSLVSIPMNQEAKALRWYVSKALQEYENTGGAIESETLTPEQTQEQAQYLIEKAFSDLAKLGLKDEEIAEKFFQSSSDSDSDDDSKTEGDKKKEGEDDENKKRSKVGLGTYIRRLIIETLKAEIQKLSLPEAATKSVEELKTDSDEHFKTLDSGLEDVGKKLTDLDKQIDEVKEKKLDLDKYPELKEQYDKLLEATTGLAKRIDEIEENVGGSYNIRPEKSEKGKWAGSIFPPALQS